MTPNPIFSNPNDNRIKPSICQVKYRLQSYDACYHLEGTNMRFCMLCIDKNHEGHADEKYKGEHLAEGIRTPFASPASQCNCPCTDKRTKEYKLFKNKFSLDLRKYHKAGNKGLISYFEKPRVQK